MHSAPQPDMAFICEPDEPERMSVFSAILCIAALSAGGWCLLLLIVLAVFEALS